MFVLRNLQRNLKLPRSTIQEIQGNKLRLLVNHAYENVLYYRQLFDSNRIRLRDIKGIKDLEKIPVTDKTVMRAVRKADIMAKNINPKECVEVFTSGSTGMPTHIFFTRKDYEFLDLVYLRSFLQNGLKFKHKRAFILDPHSFETKKCWYHRLGIATYANISCFWEPEKQVQVLKGEKPDFIHGYPSSLRQVAEFISDSKIDEIKPHIISTAAELLHPKDRQFITSVLGAPVYDRYAARECGNIAWECNEHNGYHINIDSLVVEFLKDGRPVDPGEKGDVVITNLHSYAMPFIRYKIGDIGVLSDKMCPCGIELPLMDVIEGRDEDFILLKDGKKISPMMVTGTLDHIPGIKQFRVVQEGINSVLVVITKGKDFQSHTVTQVEKDLKGLFGWDMDVRCQVVDGISRESSGKVRTVISRLS